MTFPLEASVGYFVPSGRSEKGDTLHAE